MVLCADLYSLALDTHYTHPEIHHVPFHHSRRLQIYNMFSAFCPVYLFIWHYNIFPTHFPRYFSMCSSGILCKYVVYALHFCLLLNNSIFILIETLNILRWVMLCYIYELYLAYINVSLQYYMIYMSAAPHGCRIYNV
jgi:hypothetical protein